ncbi:MAG: hypothetical protein HDT44_07190 [Ruminococcaceae bacterium]|nr:hypothetical protein [Oscillospiraceae bacterium]
MARGIEQRIDEYVQNVIANGTIPEDGIITDPKQKIELFTTWGADLWKNFPAYEVRKGLEYFNNKYFDSPYDINKFNFACFSFFTTFKEDYQQCWDRDFPFVLTVPNKTGSFEYKVDFKLLAEYIKQKGGYFFVKNNIFLYNSDLSIYEIVSNDELRGYIMDFVNALNCTLAKTSGIDGALKDVKSDSEHKIDFNAFNADRNIINFQNGILHLDTMALTPHSPDVLSTIQIPCNWNAEDKDLACPVFDGYLNDLSNGDSEIIRFLWQYIGLAISNIPGYITKQALFIYGEPNTGKSKIFDLLAKLLGNNNYTVTELSDLEGDFGTYSLLNKRLAGSPDMSYLNVTELRIFKQLTGGDDIKFKEKYKSPFDGKYKGVLLFCANDMPKFGGDKGEATYSRMIIIKCTNVIPKEKQDKSLIDKIYSERAAIVYKAVQALKQFISNGYRFDIPSVCESETRKYKLDNDNVMQFLDECTMLRQAQYKSYLDNCTAANIYTAYTRWVKNNGEKYQAPKSEFIKTACRFYGFGDKEDIKHKYNGGRYYKFTLKTEYYNLIGFPDLSSEDQHIKAV